MSKTQSIVVLTTDSIFVHLIQNFVNNMGIQPI